MTASSPGLLATSDLIATETGRPLDTGALPDEVCISVGTIAQLQAGVLAAADSYPRPRVGDRGANFRDLPGVDCIVVTRPQPPRCHASVRS